jgi:protein TonB
VIPAARLAFFLAVQAAAARSPPPTPAAPPRPTDWPFNLFTGDDYPARAMRGGEEGRVGYHLDISPGGRVTSCTIRRSSGSAALDENTCRIVSRRARFTPARDTEGNAVPDTRDGEVTWRLPAE